MYISPVFFIAGIVLIMISLVYGLLSGYQRHKQLLKKSQIPAPAVFIIETKPLGEGSSQNDDKIFSEALKNQDASLSVILKLIQKD